MFNAPLLGGSAWPRPSQIPNLAFWVDANDDACFSSDPVTGEIIGMTTKDANAYPFVPVSANAFSRLIRSRKTNWMNRTIISSQQQGGCGLVSSNNIDIASMFAANGTDHTFFFVGRFDDVMAANGTLFYHYTTGAIGHYLQANASASGNLQYINLSSGQFFNLSNAPFRGLENIFCFRRTGNALQMYMNGALISSIPSTATAIVSTLTTMKLFCPTTSGGGFHGDVAELIMYARSLSDNERFQVENHLARKWLGLD